SGTACGATTAGGAGLNHVGAVFDLQADCLPNLFRAVSHSIQGRLFSNAGLESVLVTMPTSNPDGVTGSFHARADCPAFVNGFAQSHIVKASCRPDIAHSGKAGHQSVTRVQDTENNSERIL